MSDYTRTISFTAKDALASGSPGKIIKGADIDSELNAVASASGSKLDKSGGTVTGALVLNGNVTGTGVIFGGTY